GVRSGAAVGPAGRIDGRPSGRRWLQRGPRWSDAFPVAWRAAVVAVAGALGVAGAAGAASSLRLPEPPGFGEVESATLDTEGIPLGPSRLTLTRDPAGWVALEAESTISGGDSVHGSARLEPVAADGTLRLVSQRSLAVVHDGALLVEMAIDHVARRATCTTPEG